MNQRYTGIRRRLEIAAAVEIAVRTARQTGGSIVHVMARRCTPF
tara:strand:+ start:1952 stop:2083 length:132 start_codon:yes stop_codon:yes gene_type:complete